MCLNSVSRLPAIKAGYVINQTGEPTISPWTKKEKGDGEKWEGGCMVKIWKKRRLLPRGLEENEIEWPFEQRHSPSFLAWRIRGRDEGVGTGVLGRK